jgi:hypothetical protein
MTSSALPLIYLVDATGVVTIRMQSTSNDTTIMIVNVSISSVAVK